MGMAVCSAVTVRLQNTTFLQTDQADNYPIIATGGRIREQVQITMHSSQLMRNVPITAVDCTDAPDWGIQSQVLQSVAAATGAATIA